MEILYSTTTKREVAAGLTAKALSTSEESLEASTSPSALKTRGYFLARVIQYERRDDHIT